MTCKHDIAEQDTYVADGYCPLCLLDQIQRLQARVEALEETLIEVLVDNGRTRDEAQHIADLATGRGVSEWFWER